MTADPASATVTAVATTLPIITLTGSIFGLQYDAMLIGLFAGLIGTMHIQSAPPENTSKCAAVLKTGFMLLSAAVLGALFSPVAVAASVEYLPFTKNISPVALRLAAAGAIGLCAQVAVPLLLSILQRKGGSV